jgi:hypothetical protein
MNTITIWFWSVLFTLVLGSFAYATLVGTNAESYRQDMEDRITRQLDIIERKLDQVIIRQWEQDRKR